MSTWSSQVHGPLPRSVIPVPRVPSRRRLAPPSARLVVITMTGATCLLLAVSLYLSFALPGSFDLTTMHTAAGRLAVRWVAPNGPASGLGVVAGALLMRGTAHHALVLSVAGAVQRRLVLSPSLLVPTLWDLLDATLGVFMLILGLMTRLHGATPAARAFWCLALLASLSVALNPATTHGLLWAIVLQALALRLFGPALLALVLAFARCPSSVMQRWWRLLCWLPALLLVAAYPFYWIFPTPLVHVMPQAEGLVLAGYILASGAAVAYALRRPWSDRRRMQLHWVASGLLGGLLPFEVCTLLPLTLVGRAWLAPEASILALALLPCGIAVAILRVDVAGDMARIQRLLRILIGTTALALLVSGVAFFVLEAARLWNWPLPVASAGIGLSSTLLVAAVGRRLLGRAERLLSVQGYDPATTDDQEPSGLNPAEHVALITSDACLTPHESDTCLTPHELEVLEHLARGLTNKEIARQLGRSAKTVEKHIAAIYAKLDVHSRLQAVTVARYRGLVRPD